MNYLEKITESTNYIKQKLNDNYNVAIVLGSGLGELAQDVIDPIIINYDEIVHFPKGNVKGHNNRLVIGQYKNQNVIMLQGRFHFYEGFSMKEVAFPIYVLSQLGVKNLILTNSCGAINTEYEPGDLVLINDFINLVFNNPLIGENFEELGTRFPDMSEPYSPLLREKFQEANRIILNEGCYGYFSGPYYETKKEIQAFKTLGCDLIGMSTVPETIAAVHAGINVLAIACVTNMATGIQTFAHSHDNVVKVANEISITLKKYLENFFEFYKF